MNWSSVLKNQRFFLFFAGFAILILLLLAGVFLYLKKINDQGLVYTSEPFSHYKIIDSQGKKFIENKKAGISFFVPDGWNVNMTGKEDKKQGEPGIVEMTSQDSNSTVKTLPTKGCGMSFYTEYWTDKQEVNFLATMAKNIAGNILDQETKTFETQYRYGISGVKAGTFFGLKIPTFIKAGVGQGFEIEIPINGNKGKVYFLDIYYPETEKDRCEKELSDFLSGVSIRN